MPCQSTGARHAAEQSGAGAATATIVVGAWIGEVLLEPPSLTLYMMQVAGIVVAVAAVWLFGPKHGTTVSERGAVFVLVLVLAGVIAFGFEVRQDARFDSPPCASKTPRRRPWPATT